MEDSLQKGYEPREVEEKWYRFWLEQDLFHAQENSAREPFSMVIPPPNVTGALHMGHALNNTIQDILARWQRMRGREVLWMPGTDHAGIATQNVVERELAKEGTSRHDLGREKFIERVWSWRREYGHRIINQLQRLGASCDWDRERFTMDEGLSRAVREVFVRLYEEELIYRGNYIINWCPRCRTALSDLEVEHDDHAGHLFHVRYRLEGEDGFIEVATTRPETILGDTAVAFNPADDRYVAFRAGKKRALLPVLGRSIPIIGDDFVDPAFGTGAVKITPAHDPADYQVSLRHGLPAIKVIDDDGRMTAEAGPYAGLDRFECRARLLEDLAAAGLLVKTEDHLHAVGHCYRCKTIIEPNLSLQWFVRVAPLAEQAIKAVEDGRIRITPVSWEKTYFEWMRNIKDWCISRQIWWGHRIPAWYCDCGRTIVSRTAPSTCPACGSSALRQDEDVLDTWFSSALWPFSTMGWPDRTPTLEKFYPTSVLVTAFDILFFWVARMIMMGLKFMDDVPFRDVHIHAIVRDAEGQKMSKSKGNVIDPLEIIDRFGTDAFRFSLAAFAAQGRDIKLSEERIEGYRHFCNKIWNASRFVLMNLEPGARLELPVPGSPDLADRWIMSRLGDVAGTVNRSLAEYKFNDAASAIYSFFWNEFCDWYLELAKPRLLGADAASRDRAREHLVHVLDAVLRLLHPFMPFITEEVRQKLPVASGSIMLASYPVAEAFAAYRAPADEALMATVMEAIAAVRTVRGEMNISPAAKITVIIKPHDPALAPSLDAHGDYIRRLAGVERMSIDPAAARPPAAATCVTTDMDVFVPLGGLLDLARERERLVKTREKLEKELAVTDRKLGNADFIRRAPDEVVQEERRRKAEMLARRERLQGNLASIEEALA